MFSVSNILFHFIIQQQKATCQFVFNVVAKDTAHTHTRIHILDAFLINSQCKSAHYILCIEYVYGAGCTPRLILVNFQNYRNPNLKLPNVKTVTRNAHLTAAHFRSQNYRIEQAGQLPPKINHGAHKTQIFIYYSQTAFSHVNVCLFICLFVCLFMYVSVLQIHIFSKWLGFSHSPTHNMHA